MKKLGEMKKRRKQGTKKRRNEDMKKQGEMTKCFKGTTENVKYIPKKFNAIYIYRDIFRTHPKIRNFLKDCA